MSKLGLSLVIGVACAGSNGTARADDGDAEWAHIEAKWGGRVPDGALAPLDPAQDGAPLLLESSASMAESPEGVELFANLGIDLDLGDPATLRALGTEAARHPRPLKLIQSALSRPRCGWAVRGEGGRLTVGEFSYVSDLLVLRAVLSAMDGDVASAASGLAQVAEFARRQPDYSQGVGRNVLGLDVASGAQLMAELSRHPKAKLRAALEPVLAGVPAGAPLLGMIEADLALTVEIVRRWCAGEDVAPIAEASSFAASCEWLPEQRPGPELVPKVRAATVAYVASAEAMLVKLREFPSSVFQGECGGPQELLKSLRSYAVTALGSRRQVQLTRAGLAVLAYRETKGRWPASLGDLKDEFPGSTVPGTEGEEGPFEYKIVGDGFSITSKTIPGTKFSATWKYPERTQER